MKLWILTALILATILDHAESNCVSTPCTQTDYRSYSNCISNQCPNTVVATGCPENKCSSVNCNTCSGSNSNACCQSCCRPSSCECTSVTCDTCSSSNACCSSCCSRQSKCNCPSVDCNSCQGYGACCQTCCKQSDCCQNTNKEQCCNNNPNSNCCAVSPQPAPREIERIILPSFPNITLPNITIIINQSAPIIHNNPNFSVNQTCPSQFTQSNNSLCLNISSPQSQPCCTMPYRQECTPVPYPPYNQCPPVQYAMTCGPQCLQQVQQPLLRQVQPIYIQPQPAVQPIHQLPIYQPQIVQPQIIQQPIVQPRIVQPQIIQQPIVQPQIYQQPIVQPQIVQQPIVQPQVVQPQIVQPQIVQPQILQQRLTGCYVNYQYPQCPSYCVGGCAFIPNGAYQSGYQNCLPSTSFPFMRCPPYYGAGGTGVGTNGAGAVLANRPYYG